MSIRARRQKYFDDRERLFITTACDMIKGEGLSSLRMANLSARCEYAVGTLYQHFSCKEDLLLAIACEEIRARAERIEKTALSMSDTRSRMMSAVLIDAEEMEAKSAIAQVSQLAQSEAIWSAASECRRASVSDANRRVVQALAEIVKDAMSRGALISDGIDAEQLAAEIWAMSFGVKICVIAAGARGIPRIESPRSAIARHLGAVLDDLRWQPL